MRRAAALLVLPVLAACQPAATGAAVPARCAVESGFAARADDARAAGVEGEVLPTTTEAAAMRTCAARPAVKAGCSLRMVGGTGYACATGQ